MSRKKYYMIGYTHIDPVWLWNRAEGMQEVKSSFVSALERLKEFPDFKFSHTSIAFLEWLKENCPAQFSQIKLYLEQGRWEIIGSMWVEPDCDLPCGEALIRHFLYGSDFLKRELGVQTAVCFSPDSFGHGANLPAILNGCGISYYALSRPADEYVKLPPVFVWKSPNGSSVIAERTGGEYMAWTRPALERNLQESSRQLDETGYDRMAVFYGVGNHGGGPTVDNIHTVYELHREYKDGELDFGTLKSFFDAVETNRLPVVTGELGRIYWGCYSSDSAIKRGNRKAEWTLLKAEAIAAMAVGIGIDSYHYPAELLEQAWKEVLFNQFHDILAGTAFEPGRTAACREFGMAVALGERIIRNGVQAIVNELDTRGEGFSLVLVNPTGADFAGVFPADVYMPRAKKKPLRLRNPKGEEIPYCETVYQNVSPDSRKCILFEARVPAYGYSVYRVIAEAPNDVSEKELLKAAPLYLDNGIIRMDLDMRTGCPSSLKIRGNECLGASARMAVFYDDRGAWGETVYDGKCLGNFDIVRSYVAEQNALRVIVRVILGWEKSELRVDYILEKDSDILKMNFRLHNVEKHRKIDFCLPVAVRNPKVWTETAFLVESKIDCMDSNQEHYQHRFADVEDTEGRGIAVINDGIYACEQAGPEYRMILSRSSVYARGGRGPLPENLDTSFMDQGVIDGWIWLVPHWAGIKKQRLFELADFMHMPLEYLGDSCHAGQKWLRQDALLKISRENVVISCMKQSLEQEESLVIRAFETEGREGSFAVASEAAEGKFSFSPWEIKTLRLNGGQFLECNMLEQRKPESDEKQPGMQEDSRTKKMPD